MTGARRLLADGLGQRGQIGFEFLRYIGKTRRDVEDDIFAGAGRGDPLRQCLDLRGSAETAATPKAGHDRLRLRGGKPGVGFVDFANEMRGLEVDQCTGGRAGCGCQRVKLQRVDGDDFMGRPVPRFTIFQSGEWAPRQFAACGLAVIRHHFSAAHNDRFIGGHAWCEQHCHAQLRVVAHHQLFLGLVDAKTNVLVGEIHLGKAGLAGKCLCLLFREGEGGQWVLRTQPSLKRIAISLA